MQSTNALLRVGTRLLILALTSFVLVALGCTGAQAFPETALPSVSSSAELQPAALQMTLDVLSLDTSEKEQTSCIPGRDKVRVEHNAIVPTLALLQHSPGSNGATLPRNMPRQLGAAQRAGRIPDALTHLDLGIVRT
ncbi:hypothetical protein ART_3851 [Arthrobacter sp. PAMC 25486]|uniref:hypothetical protein n=1 Tax=Arthrobacter sp. PAMC 25486 TaxID=1494608 RepID=UPI000535D2FE|nr:hypothetical protein [Arthrobacter sp. PAMC 25486]AIY03450.1 hypothetical protein ART_3851 [Arthrobacter sp. PAMC 25486]